MPLGAFHIRQANALQRSRCIDTAMNIEALNQRMLFPTSLRLSQLSIPMSHGAFHIRQGSTLQ